MSGDILTSKLNLEKIFMEKIILVFAFFSVYFHISGLATTNILSAIASLAVVIFLLYALVFVRPRAGKPQSD